MPDPILLNDLPLFPLQSVLFPGGLLALRIFEARYLDLISRCLREQVPFGVVCLSQGGEVQANGQPVRFEPVGVLAQLRGADAEGPNVLKVWCEGGERFRLLGEATQQAEGLWVAPQAELLPADAPVAPEARFDEATQALARALDSLQAREPEHFPEARLPARRLDDAGWVANRWCELLPISLTAKQKLMELNDPVARLTLVDDFLRKQQVI